MPDSDEPARIPIEEALPGMTIVPLPEGVSPECAYVLIKTRLASGDSSWSFRSPDEGYNAEELLGALISQADWLRHQLLGEWDS